MSGVERTAGGPRTGMLPAETRCRVEADESSATVRLSGMLDPVAVDRVRDALLARLCDRPGPIVVDLAELRATGDAAGRLLTDVRHAVVDWPAADVLVVDPAGTVGGAAAAELGSCATMDEALATLARRPMAAVLDAELPPAVDAARRARAMVADGCARWGVPELTEPGCIAVTEMVNNVVAHALTPMTVRLAPRDSSLHVAVRDHSPRQPASPGLAPPTSTGGRGLLLIDTVTRRWGSTAVPNGKVVWCVLDVEDEAPRRG
ncbi:ATP-binding protein [Micromonospora psammae]|uniref:ATP-binding protein n=1 Tax=Micromonospora sp. CPCC 205556 TaxID=3122398 RepID=UPI002FEF8E84